jgi:hypothetical protein
MVRHRRPVRPGGPLRLGTGRPGHGERHRYGDDTNALVAFPVDPVVTGQALRLRVTPCGPPTVRVAAAVPRTRRVRTLHGRLGVPSGCRVRHLATKVAHRPVRGLLWAGGSGAAGLIDSRYPLVRGRRPGRRSTNLGLDRPVRHRRGVLGTRSVPRGEEIDKTRRLLPGGVRTRDRSDGRLSGRRLLAGVGRRLLAAGVGW